MTTILWLNKWGNYGTLRAHTKMDLDPTTHVYLITESMKAEFRALKTAEERNAWGLKQQHCILNEQQRKEYSIGTRTAPEAVAGSSQPTSESLKPVTGLKKKKKTVTTDSDENKMDTSEVADTGKEAIKKKKTKGTPEQHSTREVQKVKVTKKATKRMKVSESSTAEESAEPASEDGNESLMHVNTNEDEEKDDSEEEAAAAPVKGNQTIHSSPDFLVDDMSTPKFRADMKAMKICAISKILSSGQFQVSCSYENREKVAEWIKNNAKGGQTYTCDEDRIGISVVKGIDWEESAEDVRKYFEEHTDLTLGIVRKFQPTLKEGQRKKHWWVISTPTKANTMELIKIREYEGSRIVWEPYISKGACRCFNCQRWNHLAGNCLHKIRCAWCKEDHPKGECKIGSPQKGQTDFSTYFCVNCNKGGHWAGHPSCKHYIAANSTAKAKAKARIEGQRKDAQPSAPHKNSTMQQIPTAADFNHSFKRNNGEQYKQPAAVEQREIPKWNPKSAQQPANTKNAWSKVNDISHDLFGRSTVDIMKECNNFIKLHDGLKSREERQAAYIGFLLSLSGW